MKNQITFNLHDYALHKRTIETCGRYVLDHEAVQMGYLARNNVYIEQYVGKYGSGYIIHYPTAETINKSKRYHKIAYWIDRER